MSYDDTSIMNLQKGILAVLVCFIVFTEIRRALFLFLLMNRKRVFYFK